MRSEVASTRPCDDYEYQRTLKSESSIAYLESQDVLVDFVFDSQERRDLLELFLASDAGFGRFLNLLEENSVFILVRQRRLETVEDVPVLERASSFRPEQPLVVCCLLVILVPPATFGGRLYLSPNAQHFPAIGLDRCKLLKYSVIRPLRRWDIVRVAQRAEFDRNTLSQSTENMRTSTVIN